MSVSTISQGDSRLPFEGIKARIRWFAVLSMCLGGVIYLPIVSIIVVNWEPLIIYFPLQLLAPRFAASLHPNKTSGWFPLLHCVEFPIFFPLPTISAVMAIIGLRWLYRYGNTLLGSCCTEKYLLWMLVIYCSALASVAFTLMGTCFFRVGSLMF